MRATPIFAKTAQNGAGDVAALLLPTGEKFQRMRNGFHPNPLGLFIRW